jgi:23S rRNA pseudouridine1911/1915/1917 synthase
MLLRVQAEDTSERPPRIDSFLAVKTGITRSRLKRLIHDRHVLVNGREVKSNYRVREGDKIELTVPREEASALLPEDIPLEILHIDGDVAVVNKPPSMVVYPAAGHAGGTLMNALAYHSERLADIGGPLRPGIVHRLDKDTSGLMVVALSDRAYYALTDQFRHRAVSRSYVALVLGAMRGERGEIGLRIGRSISDRKKMSTRTRRGRAAGTHWEAIERFQDHATLISARLQTGRTHQIRVHMAAIGHPVLGDRTYGKKTQIVTGGGKLTFPRQMLHAEGLGFTHPAGGEWVQFHAPPPADMQEALSNLREAAATGA